MQLEIAFPDRPPPPISPANLWDQIDPEARVVALETLSRLIAQLLAAASAEETCDE